MAQQPQRTGGAPIPKPAAPTRAQQAQTLYGSRPASGGVSDSVGTHASAVATWSDRTAAKFRDDPERREQTRREARQVEEFARTYGWTPGETQLVATKMLERETFMRTQAAKEQLRPQVWEALRLKHGSEEAARAVLANATKAQTAFGVACPTLAQRAAENGVGEDPEVIEVFARHPEPVSTPKE
jgi:hypothetical protein